VQIYIDESGSINNKNTAHSPYFVIALVRVIDKEKLQRVYKRFVASNLSRLKELDADRYNSEGLLIRQGGKMFDGDRFKELKGTQFDHEMKQKFVEFFLKKPYFDVFFIRINNSKLSDTFCSNTARVFNYTLRLAMGYFIKHGLLPNEPCIMQLDERNEKTETKFFLENYLNTELTMNGTCSGPFEVSYFDSSNNKFIQIADVFANFYYSHLQKNAYSVEFNSMMEAGVIRHIFDFPPEPK